MSNTGFCPRNNKQLTYTVLYASTRGAHRGWQSHFQHVHGANFFEGNRPPLLSLHALAGNIFLNNIFWFPARFYSMEICTCTLAPFYY